VALAPPISCPKAVKEALVKYDWRLRLEWDPRENMYKILRLRGGWHVHPTIAYQQLRGRMLDAYLTVMAITRPSGRARSPEWRDFHTLRASEISSVHDLLWECSEKERKYEAELDRQQTDRIENTFGESAYRYAIGRTITGHTPKGARYW